MPPPPPCSNQTVPFLSVLYIGFCGIRNSASEKTFRSLKNSDLAQLPHFTGGETEAQRETSDQDPQRVHDRAGSSLWSAGSLSAVSGPMQSQPTGQESVYSGLGCAPYLCSDLLQVLPSLVSISPSEPGVAEVCCPLQDLPPATRNLGRDLRKTTYRVMIRVCCRNSQDIGDRAEEL